MKAAAFVEGPLLGRQVSAIIVREVQSRYTGDALGYGWAYITPLAWIGLIYVIFTYLGRASPIDTDLGSFIISGVLPYLAFRFQVSAALRAKATYRHVTLLPGIEMRTVYLAIAALEFCNALLIYLVLLTANFHISGAFELHRVPVWLFGFALASGSGAALGYAVSANAARADSASRVMAVLLRPMFYISPVFYIADELPTDAIWLIQWNPLLHAIEVLRAGAFHSFETHVGTLWVPLGFIVICLMAGRSGEARLGAGGTAAEAVME